MLKQAVKSYYRVRKGCDREHQMPLRSVLPTYLGPCLKACFLPPPSLRPSPRPSLPLPSSSSVPVPHLVLHAQVAGPQPQPMQGPPRRLRSCRRCEVHVCAPGAAHAVHQQHLAGRGAGGAELVVGHRLVQLRGGGRGSGRGVGGRGVGGRGAGGASYCSGLTSSVHRDGAHLVELWQELAAERGMKR